MLSVNSSKRRGSRIVASISATLVLGLVGAAGAYADDPSLNGYGGPGGGVEGTVDQGGQLPSTTSGPGTALSPAEVGGNEVLGAKAQGGNAPAGKKAAGGKAPAAAVAPAAAQARNRLVRNLPFTGLDVALLVAAGLGLAGLGLGLRRLTGSQPQAG